MKKLNVYLFVIAAAAIAFMLLLNGMTPYYRGGQDFDAEGAKQMAALVASFAVGAWAYARVIKEITKD